MYSQKHSACTVRKIPTVLAEKRFFSRKFARVAVLAVLLCVCGAASAWGQYYWNAGNRNSPLYWSENWLLRNLNGSFSSASPYYPETNEYAWFGVRETDTTSSIEKAKVALSSGRNTTVTVDNDRVAYEIAFYLDDNTSNVTVRFARPTQVSRVSSLSISNSFAIRAGVGSLAGLSNINISLDTTVNIGSAAKSVHIIIPSGCRLEIANTTTIYGNITIESGGRISVNGTLNLNGNITNNGGTVEIGNSGNLTVTGNTSFASVITNNGTFTNHGTLTLTENFCTFNNNSTFTNTGTFNANGSPFTNGATASSSWYNTGTVNIIHAKFTFPNEVTDSGTWVYQSINNDMLLIKNVVYNNLTVNSTGHVTVEKNFTVNGNINISSASTFYLDDYTLTAKGNWHNEGNVFVGANGNAIFVNPATDDGRWIYQASRTGIVDIKYSALNIGDENNQVSVKLDNAVKAEYIAIAENNSMLDLVGFDATVGSISAPSGKIRLHGSQTIAQENGTAANISASYVELYGDTGDTVINVSKLGSPDWIDPSIIGFGTLVCDLSGGSDKKVLDFTGVTSIGTLTLKGNSTNKLGITGNTDTSIALANAGSGSNLKINYANVELTVEQYDVSDGTSRDFAGNAVYNLHNGWKFPDPPASSTVYYWVGGTGNWSVASNWKYNSATGVTAAEYPGTNANAEVHIEPATAATVTLDVSPTNSIKSIELNNNATLAIGANTLTVNDTITNSGTIDTGNGGRLNLNGVLTNNASGTVNVQNNSTFNLTHSNTLTSRNYGIINLVSGTPQSRLNINARFINETSGTLEIGNGYLNLRYSDTYFTNTGTITIRDGGDFDPHESMNTAPDPTSHLQENGKWIYENFDAGNINARHLANLRNSINSRNTVGYPFWDLEIRGNNRVYVHEITAESALTPVRVRNKLTVSGNALFDLNGRYLTVESGKTVEIASGGTMEIGASTLIATGATIENSGTIRVQSTANVNTTSANITNKANSKVEFHGTGTADVSKLGASFYDLTCTAGGKTLNFTQSISVANNLTLNGAAGNPLVIDGTNDVKISLTKSNQSGQYLNINHTSVGVAGTGVPFNATQNCFDRTGNRVYDLKNGWKFPDASPSSNVYYWVGGNGNWSDTNNWKYDNPNGNAANEAPGTNTDAEVHIEPTAAATVTLNVSTLANPLKSITISTSGTLAIGASNLTVNTAWSNSGTVTITNGNVRLPTGTTDNGTWRYENTSARDLINITYNNLTINPGVTVNARNDVVVKETLLVDTGRHNSGWEGNPGSLNIGNNLSVSAKTFNVAGKVYASGNNNINVSNIFTMQYKYGTDSLYDNTGLLEFNGGTINANIIEIRKIVNIKAATEIHTSHLLNVSTGTLGYGYGYLRIFENANVKIVGYNGSENSVLENRGGTVQINGNLDLTGDIENKSGSFSINNRTTTISGNLTNAGSITITSANTTLNVTGTTTNSGTFTNNANASVTFRSSNTFTNTGTVTNNAGATFNMNAPLTNNGSGTIRNDGTFDFQTGTFTNTATFSNANTTRIKAGVTVTNSGNIDNYGATGSSSGTSTVEYYGDTTNTSATPNFGTAYYNLTATTANGLRAFNFDQDISVNGNMTLAGTNGNRLVIDGANKNITLSSANTQTGDWLHINYNNVSVNAPTFSPAYKVENSVDGAGNRAFGLQRGWQFPENNLYYWVGGTSNDWTEPNNWRLGSQTSTSVPITYPGNAAGTPATTNAEVFISQISPAANIILDTTATINAIGITDANATLALGTNDLTVNNSWQNRGNITLVSGNVNLGANATVAENGTWTYNNTADRDIVNIAYNNLVLAGTSTITPNNHPITANTVSINTGTTLALGANNMTVRNRWANTGTVTIASGNATLPAGTTDNGTWTYTETRTGIVPITYNTLNLHGSTAATITPTAAVTANNVNINNDTTLALGANSLAVRGTDPNSWTNSGTVTVTSGNATFTTPATDNGKWIYASNRTGLVRNITYKDIDIGDGINTANVVLNSGLDSTGTLEIKSGCQLDLVNYSVSAANIKNNGNSIVRLYGTQNITGAGGTGTPAITNDASSTVEYYRNTGNTEIDVSKFGTAYGDLVVNGYNKTLAFANTTVGGKLILKGANDNAPLTITTNGGGNATITVASSQQNNTGDYLRIDRANVTISGLPFETGTSYYAKNSYDTDESSDDALKPVRNGWKIDIPIQLTNMLLSVAPIGGNAVYVRAEQGTMDGLSGVPSGLINNMLKRFFKIYNSTVAEAGITVTNASLVRNGSKVTWIRLSLSGMGSITLDSLQKYYVRTYTNAPSAGGSTEGFHQISDFAVGAVTPLFAYDNRYADSDANWQTSATTSGVAVRNWDAGQGNEGSLLSKKDIVMSVRLPGGSGNDMGNPVLYMSNNPASGSQSNKYNGDTNSSWRVWLPNVTGVGELAGTPNNNTIDTATGNITVSGSGTNPILNIPAGSSSSYNNWKDGDQITFMFELKDTGGASINVGGDHGTASHPLYALRLRDAGDINSLDLWSVRLRGMTAQRGGVSIRNNVINVTTGEQVTVEVDMPTSGTLNVMVMTLDGSIVKYLQHGTASEGKHAYHWGGLTNSGSPVARGLYFVRIVGSGIDETRKVMVVK